MINSLAVIYVYNQFSSLRKAGSKYLLSKANTPLSSVLPHPHPHPQSSLLTTHSSHITHLLLTGIAGLFTIFASFVFGSGVVNLIDETASGLK